MCETQFAFVFLLQQQRQLQSTERDKQKLSFSYSFSLSLSESITKHTHTHTLHCCALLGRDKPHASCIQSLFFFFFYGSPSIFVWWVPYVKRPFRKTLSLSLSPLVFQLSAVDCCWSCWRESPSNNVLLSLCCSLLWPSFQSLHWRGACCRLACLVFSAGENVDQLWFSLFFLLSFNSIRFLKTQKERNKLV